MGFIPQIPDYTVSQWPEVWYCLEKLILFSYLNNANIKAIAHAQHIGLALNKKHI